MAGEGGGGVGIGTMLFGAALGGAGAMQENWKKERAKDELLQEYKYLVSLYSPVRAKLIQSYAPGGEYSQRLAGMNREQSNAMQRQVEEAGRTNAYRTGGIRSGAVDRARRGSWLDLMAQGQTSADMGALSRYAAQNLATKGAKVRMYQYPGFGSPLTDVAGAVTAFGQEYERQ